MARRGDGIYLRGKTWWLDFVHDGRRHVARIGKGINRTAAGEIASVKRAAILKGEAGIGEASSVTLDAYANGWLKEVAGNLAPATLANYTWIWRLHIRPTLGGTKLHAIDRKRVKALLAAKRAEGLSKASVRLIRATLAVMLADALDDGIITTNPMPGLTRRGRKGPDTITRIDREQTIRPMSPEQLAAFLDATRDRQGVWTLFLTLADTGARPGEALALRWDDFDPEGQTLTIERALSDHAIKATKTDTSRRVELTPRLLEALDRWQTEQEKEALTSGREASPWVFPSEGPTNGPEKSGGAPTFSGPLELRGLQGRFKRALRRAKLPTFRLYDLRHTYASHALMAGAPITYVAAQLGHAKPTMTLTHYARWIPSAERVWGARLQRARAFPNAIHNTPQQPPAAGPQVLVNATRNGTA